MSGSCRSALAGLAVEDAALLPLDEDDPAPGLVQGCGTRGWFVRGEDDKLLLPYPERRDRSPRLFRLEGAAWADERLDLAAERPERVEQLRAAWARWSAGAPDQAAARALGPEAEARLRALGYVR